MCDLGDQVISLYIEPDINNFVFNSRNSHNIGDNHDPDCAYWSFPYYIQYSMKALQIPYIMSAMEHEKVN